MVRPPVKPVRHGARYRVFVRVADDTYVRRLRDSYLQEAESHFPLLLLSPELRNGTRLLLGMWHGRYYAMLERRAPLSPGGPNILSAWGDNPVDATEELGFRWAVLCNSSWDPAEFVKPRTERDNPAYAPIYMDKAEPSDYPTLPDWWNDDGRAL